MKKYAIYVDLCIFSHTKKSPNIIRKIIKGTAFWDSSNILKYFYLHYRTQNYFDNNFLILSAASFVSSGLPNDENRKYPSPHLPKPSPGVPIT